MMTIDRARDLCRTTIKVNSANPGLKKMDHPDRTQDGRVMTSLRLLPMLRTRRAIGGQQLMALSRFRPCAPRRSDFALYV